MKTISNGIKNATRLQFTLVALAPLIYSTILIETETSGPERADGELRKSFFLIKTEDSRAKLQAFHGEASGNEIVGERD